MRPFIPLTLWLAALVQLPLPDQLAPEGATAILTTAATLAGLIVMVYRLGIWRQEMYNTKHNIGAEIARYREENSQCFQRLELRFNSIDAHIAAATEQRVASERWRARADTTLASHERDLTTVGQRIGRLEHLEQGEPQ